MGVQFETKFVEKKSPRDKRITSLIKYAKTFSLIGIAPQTKGNLSFRTNGGFVITGTGKALGELGPQDFVEVVGLKKKNKKFIVYCWGEVVPSMETVFHKEIYDLRPEINTVFHLHDNSVLKVGEKLRIASTKKEQPSGSYLLVREIKKLLKKKRVDYFILKNHGIVALGETVAGANNLVKKFHKISKETICKNE